LQTALDAAEQGEQHALYIKLSNNMGAVLRKQELHEEVRVHLESWEHPAQPPGSQQRSKQQIDSNHGVAPKWS
jgi:hypothetical protein